MRLTRIGYSSKFLRSAKKLPTEIQSELLKKEAVFRQNCFDPKLKTHKLSGKLKNFWSFSITYSYRVLFTFTSSNSADLMDIGDHAIYQ